MAAATSVAKGGTTAKVATAAGIAGIAALMGSGVGVVVGPLLVIGGCAGLGAWRLRRLHRRLVATHFAGALGHGLDGADTDDEAEESTFAALQRAEEHLELAGLLLDERAPAELRASHERLSRRFEEFVFSGVGLGDLVAAWALEQDCEALADDALTDRRRPAA